MLHDRTSLYENLMQRKRQNAFVSFFFTLYEYITLVGYAFLHFGPGKWLFRTPAVYTVTGALWAFLGAWYLFGYDVYIALGGIDTFNFEYDDPPLWMLWTALAITSVFFIQHNITSGAAEEKDRLYSGYPWLLAMFRLLTGRDMKADEQEEAFFKEWIEPAFVLAFAILLVDQKLAMVLLVIMAVCLATRERMIKHFYEVTQVNAQDVLERAEHIAKGAGMKMASRKKKAPKVGRINPDLKNPRASN